MPEALRPELEDGFRLETLGVEIDYVTAPISFSNKHLSFLSRDPVRARIPLLNSPRDSSGDLKTHCARHPPEGRCPQPVLLSQRAPPWFLR